VSRAWYEQPFREACLAVLPDRLATLLRATGRGMVHLALEEGLVEAGADPWGLLQGLRVDLEAVETGLAELARPQGVARENLDPELAGAARSFRAETRRLGGRMDDLLERREPPGSSGSGSEAGGG